MNAMRTLGRNGPTIFPLALGCMGMSGMYGPADENESIATIHAAIDHGVNLIDTGDFYGMGHNEMLIGRALEGRREGVLAHSLPRLRTGHIDIYRPARLDGTVPIEETVGAIADLVKAGYVRAIGLSEVGAETIRRAHAIHPIVDLQIEYSLISRGPEARIFPVLRELGIGVTAYGVLSRGLLTGSPLAAKADLRAHMPRFVGENLARNRKLIDALNRLAAERGVAPAQLAIAWVLAKDSTIVPVIGARTRRQLDESLAALEIHLTAEEIARLEEAIPASEVAGSRYAEMQMRTLDSER